MESVLRKQEGVKEAKATFWKNQAVVEYDPEKVTPRELIEAVNNGSPYRAAKFDSSFDYLSLMITGDGGLKPLDNLADALQGLPGVKVSALDPPSGKLYLEYEADKVSVEKIVERAASRTGYKLVVKYGESLEKEEAAAAEDNRKLFEKLWQRLLRKDDR